MYTLYFAFIDSYNSADLRFDRVTVKYTLTLLTE